ncbi:MAG: N-acetyl-gamma-glutamyl-phosphate reductase [Conexivisphaerales archaeon]
MNFQASIIGGSGYVGGELLRLLSGHPEMKIGKVYSKTYAGKYIHSVHPNLRGIIEKTFTSEKIKDIVESSDITFFALPHGQSSQIIPELQYKTTKIVDIGADFRLKTAEDYEKWYHYKHPAPQLLKESVYGLPELFKEQIVRSRLVSVPGCTAACAILSLAPLASKGLVERMIVDAKVGSSGSGAKPTIATHFSERFNVVRIYKPYGHRHTPEIIQTLSHLSGKRISVGMSVHAVNMVRGLQTTSHVLSDKQPDVKELWRIYRKFYEQAHFVRIVRDAGGKNKFPDPKFTFGSNYADVGFDVDLDSGRILAIGAIDNLVKGAAGNAVQCANIMLRLDEREGITSPPIHPA